jgi:hypothetical protein
MNRCFGGQCRLHHQVTRIGELGTGLFVRSVLRLLVIANVIPCFAILITLVMEEMRSVETSVFTRATRRNIPEDVGFHSHRRECLKSYTALTGCSVPER